MRRSGLKRVKKTVRGKRGNIQRTYWMADHSSNKERAKAVLLYKVAMGNMGGSFGMTEGMKIGGRLHRKNWVQCALMGGIGGSTVGHYAGVGVADATHKLLSSKNLRRATFAAHAVAIGNSVYNTYKIWKGIYRSRQAQPTFDVVRG